MKTVKRTFDNKIISSCDIKLGAVVNFVFRGADSGVAVAARPTILHLVSSFQSSKLCNAERALLSWVMGLYCVELLCHFSRIREYLIGVRFLQYKWWIGTLSQYKVKR